MAVTGTVVGPVVPVLLVMVPQPVVGVTAKVTASLAALARRWWPSMRSLGPHLLRGESGWRDGHRVARGSLGDGAGPDLAVISVFCRDGAARSGYAGVVVRGVVHACGYSTGVRRCPLPEE